MSFLAQITPLHHPLPYHYAVFQSHESSIMTQHNLSSLLINHFYPGNLSGIVRTDFWLDFWPKTKNRSMFHVYFSEYCSRNYVSNELRMSDSDWLNIIADDSLPSPRTKRKSKFFGCIPPESGSTIFQAWWWDVYNPNLDFTRDSRKQNQEKMDQMKVKNILGTESLSVAI